ncbi:putative transmembrane protein [Tieghemostelium lacteum]|uniref:Putative transmembrane protein n=1 Tax=Tieghemostelium lacteum TaxID=361077 RepID=A0A151Z6V7_TIELA|nr:putative transmembrane protein [Tieghemostelium lacteum]|eukprot:KYQ89701.1 putative transmembrane protein [Tieghemostelium lacteum]
MKEIGEIKRLQINLTRLIRSCESIIFHDNGDTDKDTANTVEKYIPIMLQQLKQLNDLVVEAKQSNLSNSTSSASTSNLSQKAKSPQDSIQELNDNLPTKETLNEFSRKIDVIVGLIDKEKLSSQISNKPTIIRLQSSNLPHSKKMQEIHTVLKTQQKEEKKKINELISNGDKKQTLASVDKLSHASEDYKSPTLRFRNQFKSKNQELNSLLGTKSNDHNNNNTVNLDEKIDNELFLLKTNEQRDQRENIATEMMSMAKSLRDQSDMMSNKLLQEDKTIDELADLLNINREKIGDQNKRLKEHISSTSKDTLNYFLIIIFVLAVFFGTYVLLIKTNRKKMLP